MSDKENELSSMMALFINNAIAGGLADNVVVITNRGDRVSLHTNGKDGPSEAVAFAMLEKVIENRQTFKELEDRMKKVDVRQSVINVLLDREREELEKRLADTESALGGCLDEMNYDIDEDQDETENFFYSKHSPLKQYREIIREVAVNKR